jgi:hypothetical protein
MIGHDTYPHLLFDRPKPVTRRDDYSHIHGS